MMGMEKKTKNQTTNFSNFHQEQEAQINLNMMVDVEEIISWSVNLCYQQPYRVTGDGDLYGGGQSWQGWRYKGFIVINNLILKQL